MANRFTDLLGTVLDTFRVGKARFDASSKSTVETILSFSETLVETVKRFKARTLQTTPQTITFSATPAVDVSVGDPCDLTLTGNVTGLTFTGGVDGQKILLRIRQDATGGRTFAFGAGVRFGTDIPSVTISSTASKMTYIGLIYDATDSQYDVVTYNRGF